MQRTRLLEVRNRGTMSLSGSRIVVVKGPDKGRALRIDKEEVVIGSAPGVDLLLTDPTVSRHHLSLRAQADGFLATDLESTNGTRVRELAIRAAVLVPGDAVDLGATRLKLSAEATRVDLSLSEAESFGELIGRSVAARRMFSLLESVAQNDVTVLFLGETGTGKDAAAEALHRAGPRAERPFVVLDCGAVAPSLLESELFGHEKGAFTGAHARRTGVFQAAHGGTLFLDEIGELPRELQPKLLRAIESRQIRPVGGNKPIDVDVRILAATNRDLKLDVNRGAFREDLYYRLAVVTIRVPPLRERVEDIPLLAEHFLRQLGGAAGETLPPELVDSFSAHRWPGNLRELRNRVERAAVLRSAGGDDGVDGPGEQPFRVAKARAIADFERAFLTALLRQAEGNTSAAARRASMDRVYLATLLRRYDISPADFKRR